MMENTRQSVRIERGMLLLAGPMMLDPNFRRGVVLLCDHGDEGSFGLIINRPLALNSEALDAALGDVTSLSFGGPVQPGTLHYLHRLPAAISDAEPVQEGIFWGGDFDSVLQLAHEEGLSDDRLRFFVGYAGWGPGQLEAEVASNDWIIAPSTPDLVFAANPEDIWPTAMRRLGGDIALFAGAPLDPRLN